jgi:hypothetical protein
MSTTGLIHFRCTAAHDTADGRPADTLTIHEAQWAYCPHDAHADGHEWTPTGGVEIQALRRRGGSSDLDVVARAGSSTSEAPAAEQRARDGARRRRSRAQT